MPHVRSCLALPLVLAAVVALPTPATAQFQLPGTTRADGPLTANRLVKVRVSADVAAIRPGATFHLVAIFEIEPGWHIYWTDPGSSGAPTEVAVKGPLGFTVGQPRYPRPEVIPDPAGATYGYHREVAIFVPITAPPSLMTGLGSAAFDAEIDYFVCKERCLIGREKRTVKIEFDQTGTADGTAAPDTRTIERYRARLPRPVADLPGGGARVERSGSKRHLVITGTAPDGSDVAFLPVSTPGVTCGEARIERTGDRFVLRIPIEVQRQNALGRELRVRGIVMTGKGLDLPCYDVDVELDPKQPWNESP